MVKGSRPVGETNSDNSASEIGDLRDMMQNLVTEVGKLAGKVLSLEKLDQAVMELRNQISGENRMGTVPLGQDGAVDRNDDVRVQRERSLTTSNTSHFHQSNFNRWSRMEFLRFRGEDLRSWLFKIDQFFSMENVGPDEKVTVAALQLEGEAIQWHLSFMRYRPYLQPPSWSDYVRALVERFGTDFEDPMEEIKKIKQVGSVKEYQAILVRNLTRVNLSQENAISCFIGGLKPELNIAVKITNPTSLSQVYRSASMQEAYLAAVRQPVSNQHQMGARRFMDQKNENNKPPLPTPATDTSSFSKGVNRRTLSMEEMNEKRAKGLCYFCTEKYMPGHKCKNLKQLYLLEVEELEEEQGSTDGQGGEFQEMRNEPLELGPPVEHMEISIHALNGTLGFRTLKVTGYHSKMGLHILIDTGSSHNFIDPELVKQLGCEVKPIKPEMVAAANGCMKVDKMTTVTWLLQGAEFKADFLLLPLGSCGVVLGIPWLLSLGDIKLNLGT